MQKNRPICHALLVGILGVLYIKSEENYVSVINHVLFALKADEAFLCGSAMEVTHITDIDGYTVGNGEVGNITRQLSECYHQIVTGQLKRYADWLTPIY